MVCPRPSCCPGTLSKAAGLDRVVPAPTEPDEYSTGLSNRATARTRSASLDAGRNRPLRRARWTAGGRRRWRSRLRRVDSGPFHHGFHARLVDGLAVALFGRDELTGHQVHQGVVQRDHPDGLADLHHRLNLESLRLADEVA